jgi:hypothetical protein
MAKRGNILAVAFGQRQVVLGSGLPGFGKVSHSILSESSEDLVMGYRLTYHGHFSRVPLSEDRLHSLPVNAVLDPRNRSAVGAQVCFR